MDHRALAECRSLFTIAKNPADRLTRFNDLEAKALLYPPPLEGRTHAGDFGDDVFTVGCLDLMKRFDLLIRAMKHTRTPVRARRPAPACSARNWSSRSTS